MFPQKTKTVGLFWLKMVIFKFYPNKPSRGVSRLLTVFHAKKLSKYRLKQPKYIVLGTPKKPDKIPKNGQNRFWVIKQCFLGKIRGKNFDTRNFFQLFFRFFGHFFTHRGAPEGCGGSHKFSTGPQLSEYVQVVCRNKNGTCLKSVSKTYFQVFPGFPAIPAPCQNPASSQMAEMGFFQKSVWNIFFALTSPN